VIRPVQDLRSPVCLKVGEGRSEDRDLRWVSVQGVDGVESLEYCEEKDGWREDNGRGG
jgi:hypothetical protein